MSLDIRVPIGLMFSIIGAILVVFGLVPNQAIYDYHSLGINVNLGWGAVLLAFGLIMLALAKRAKRRSNDNSAGNDPSP
jgi:hypothetical protein